MFEELNKRRQAVADNIAKSFENDIEKALGAGYDPEGGDGDNVEKARHGVYGDTAQNRRLNRVGQEYGSKKKEETPSGKKQSSEKKEDGGSNKLSQSAAKASDKALERASKDPKASAKNKIRTELNKFDEFSDDDWMTGDKQTEIEDKLRFYVRHYNIDEKEWNEIVKPYAEGLSGLPYEDFK